MEELDLQGRPTDCAFKRVRVTCRQVYVFSHAAMLGWAPGEALAARGCEFLIEKAWLGPENGWARRLTADGEVLDPTPDLYDIAFVLFAWAWRYRQSRDPEALKRVHQTLDFVQRHMRPTGGEGFLHEKPPIGPRVQNPHMHLLEASLAAFDATQDQRFLDQASEIVSLFRVRFFDGRTLGEYFTDDWRRLPSEKGRVIEPGHHLEWAWILAQHQRITGLDLTREAYALVQFAEAFGVDPATGLTYNQVRDDGAPLDRRSRTWPNTERVKGHLALFELTGKAPEAAGVAARLLLDKYLAIAPYGSWIDQFDAQGAAAAPVAPTSTLYHIFLAFAEMLRLEPRLTPRG